jgi:hypothetical protein
VLVARASRQRTSTHNLPLYYAGRLPGCSHNHPGTPSSRQRWRITTSRGSTKAGKMAHGTMTGGTAHFRSAAAHSDQCAALEPVPFLRMFRSRYRARSRNRNLSFVPSPFHSLTATTPAQNPPGPRKSASKWLFFRLKAHRRRHELP